MNPLLATLLGGVAIFFVIALLMYVDDDQSSPVLDAIRKLFR
jgi:hypothetical protein